MPRFNRTGPAGMGPMTGRGLGPCGGGVRRGAGRGRGMGYGMMTETCPWYGPMVKPTAKEEKEILNEQVEILKENLESVQKRLSELDSEK